MIKFDYEHGTISTFVQPDDDFVCVAIPYYLYHFVKTPNDADTIHSKLCNMKYVMERNKFEGYNVVLKNQINSTTLISKIEIVGKSRITRDYVKPIEELLILNFKRTLIDCLKLNIYHMKWYGENVKDCKRIMKNLVNESFPKVQIVYRNEFDVPVVKFLKLPQNVSDYKLILPEKLIFANNTFTINDQETGFADKARGEFLFEKKLVEFLLEK